jgi:uncharacterized Zn finger protein
MTIAQNLDVVVTWRTPGVVAASVRGDSGGIVDVLWNGSTGTCTCSEKPPCRHASAVQAVTEGGQW